MMFQCQNSDAFFAQQIYVILQAVNIIHPVLFPFYILLRCFAVVSIIDESLMIAVIISGDGRGMAAPGCMYHGANSESRRDDPVRVATNDVRLNNLFGSDDNMSAGQTGVTRYAQITPCMGIAEFIGPLQMNNGNIRIDRHHGGQRVTAKRAGHEFQVFVGPE